MEKKIKIIDLLCYMSIGDYDKLPERFCFKGVTFKLNKNKNYVSTTSGLLLTKYLDNDYLEMDLNSEIKTLDEEDEFEDIDTIIALYNPTLNDSNFRSKINQLIKNQKKIIERLKKQDNN